MTRAKSLTALLLLAGLLAAAVLFDRRPAQALTEKSIIFNFDGHCSVIRRNRTLPPDADMKLYKDDLLKTEKDSFLEVTLNGLAGFRILGESECRLVSVTDSVMQVRLETGRMLCNVKPLESGTRYLVETPLATAIVRGTQFMVDIQKQDRATKVTFAVKKGYVEVSMNDGSSLVTLAEGQAVDVSNENLVASPPRSLSENDGDKMAGISSVYLPRGEDSE